MARRLQVGCYDPVRPGQVKLVGGRYSDTPEGRRRLQETLRECSRELAIDPKCNLAVGVFAVGMNGKVLREVPKHRRRRKAADGVPYVVIHETGGHSEQRVCFAPNELDLLQSWIAEWVWIASFPVRQPDRTTTELLLSVKWS